MAGGTTRRQHGDAVKEQGHGARHTVVGQWHWPKFATEDTLRDGERAEGRGVTSMSGEQAPAERGGGEGSPLVITEAVQRGTSRLSGGALRKSMCRGVKRTAPLHTHASPLCCRRASSGAPATPLLAAAHEALRSAPRVRRPDESAS